MGAIILIAFLAMLGGFAAAMALIAYTRFGVILISGRFLAELVLLGVGLAAVLWGLPLAAVAWGVVR